jgi:tRNA modification GTPase
MVSRTGRSIDTIVAIATPPGRSGVAVIRLSGPRVRFVIETIAAPLPTVRIASLRRFTSSDGALLDEGLVIFFAGPASFTGEDCAEFQVHGSAAVIRAMLRSITAPEMRVRLAEAGEFTRRAFENGRLDLSRVEGLAALIDSETEHQRKQALLVMQGALAHQVSAWRADLIAGLAQIEAQIDFGEESDVSDQVPALTNAAIDRTRASLHATLASADRGERVREGLSVVIVGAPNAGKSSLLNALAGRDVAIVSPQAGTTRDVIEVNLDIRGYLVRVSDTAGLHDSGDIVEIEGMRRTRDRARAADIVLMLRPVGEPDCPVLDWGNASLVPVATKADLPGVPIGLPLSVVTGEGIDELVEQLATVIEARWGSESALVTHERQRVVLTSGYEALVRSQSPRLPIELCAEEIRSAIRVLDRVIGRVDVEDVLDRVFSTFCIGK